MNTNKLIQLRPLLLVIAILGFMVVNGTFLYFTFVKGETFIEAFSTGIASIFIAEAFLLMFFFAFLIAKLGWKKPGWLFFIAMSLLGSLAFSIPLQIYLNTKPRP